MDRPPAGREQRQEGLQARQALLHAALADQDVGEGALRPRVSLHDGERTFGGHLRGGIVAAQLAGEGRHGEKIRVVPVQGFETRHMRAKPRAHMLLAEHVIEELRKFRGAKIARPFGGDGLHGLDGAQVVIGVPMLQRIVERALARVHGERSACTQVSGGVRHGLAGLAIEPEGCGVEPDDRRLGPALCSLELFFLDEPTALAAGHRPCFECRRADAQAFAAAFARGSGIAAATADEIDRVLHAERLEGRGKRRHGLPIDGLPDASMLTLPDAPGVVYAVRSMAYLGCAAYRRVSMAIDGGAS